MSLEYECSLYVHFITCRNGDISFYVGSNDRNIYAFNEI